MSVFGQYLAVILLFEAEEMEDEAYSGSFSSLASRVTRKLSGVEVDGGEIAEAIGMLERFAGAKRFDDPLTGGYFRINYDNFRYYFIQESPDFADEDKDGYVTLREDLIRSYPILVNYAENGAEYAKVIIEHLKNAKQDQLDELRSSGALPEIPASNRIVTLTHNQVAEIDDETTKIINLVEAENSIDGNEILRSDVIGRLKAGRELVRAQSVRVYVLYLTLASALSTLIKKYGEQAIGLVAKKLLDLLIEQVFKK